jgi:hypothetical protein
MGGFGVWARPGAEAAPPPARAATSALTEETPRRLPVTVGADLRVGQHTCKLVTVLSGPWPMIRANSVGSWSRDLQSGCAHY